MADMSMGHERGTSRKVQKRGHVLNRLPSTQIPTRLRYGDDVNEDVTAPDRAGATPAQYMNQSVFSMIAAAGSKTDFNKRFEDSSDSEAADDVEQGRYHGRPQRRHTADNKARAEDVDTLSRDSVASDERGKQLSGRATPRPPSKHAHGPSRSSQTSHRVDVTQSSTSDSASESAASNPRDAPVMSRLLSAEAEFQAHAESASQSEAPKPAGTGPGHVESTPATLLAVRLMEIFGFDEPEKVIAEYPCWLLQSALLQGYLYLTQNHICFYAYLPKRSNIVTKTGYLSKRGRTNPKYRRYYFGLKGDVLTYYSDPSDVYFPQGNIDLRYGISASLSEEKESQKDCKDFDVTTDHRTYHFRADSAASAKEWVKALQKTIFRSHNDGNSVKIALPVENVIDIEESPVVEFAETIKVRIIENDESYAVDEYFFSFFSHGKDALSTLGSLIEDTSTARRSTDLPVARNDQHLILDGEASSPPSQRQSHTLQTANKMSVPRPLVTDGEHVSSRIRGDRVRTTRSPERESAKDDHEHRSSTAPNQGSVDSYMQSSTERDTESSTVPLSPTVEASMSASQILTRSDVFRPRSVPKLATVLASSDGDNDGSSEHEISPPSARHEGHRTRLDHVSHPVPDRRTSALKIHTDSEVSDPNLIRNTPSPTLQELAGRVGSYPFARAGALAKYIQNRSSKMSKVLAAESMSYVEKVTGMWQGGHKHYGENEGVVPDDKDVDPEDEEANVGHGDRFRLHFALPATEKLQATYFGYLHRVLPLYGKVYVSHRLFCFRSLLPGTRTKLILPLRDVENVDKEKGFRFGYHGLVLVIRGHEELFFEFNSADTRDDCTVTLLQRLESVKFLTESILLDGEDDEGEESAKVEHQLLLEARRESVGLPSAEIAAAANSQIEASTILFDDPRASILNFRPPPGMRITCLTIGSRGDVQPYIALCKGLLAEGHKPRIATHAEFGPWVKSHGIEFAAIGGDPAELMRICVENGMFTYSFLREASTKFRSWIDDLLASAWQACQNSDLLIESPSAMAGIHIAEALNIPYFRAFTMPWTRTRAYPHAFAVPEQKIGGAYNYFSYVMFDNVFWKGIAGQVNRWRQRELGLRSTNLDKMQPNKVPFLYNFSPHVVAPPLDYSDWVRVTGYWFLNESSTFQPPADLAAFIRKARDDGKKLVYIGFGSIVVSDPAALTKTVVDSVLKADVRCILSKGWSDRLGDPSSARTEIPLPADIFQIKSAPHDWLFPQVDCAVHHGGAGTTGASLRAGIPTVIKPFFGDQFFFGGRVEDLGVGILLRKVNVSVFARALWEACNSERMRTKAKRLGERIREENGVQTAIQALYRDFEYAKTLVRSRHATSKPGDARSTPQTAPTGQPGSAGVAVLDYETEADLDNEESWAFVGDEDEADEAARRRLAESRVSLGPSR